MPLRQCDKRFSTDAFATSWLLGLFHRCFSMQPHYYLYFSRRVHPHQSFRSFCPFCPFCNHRMVTTRNFHSLKRSASQDDSSRRFQPTPEELEVATTDRSRNATFNWYARYQELIEYRAKYGDCNVPQKYEPNHALGTVRIIYWQRCGSLYGPTIR